MSNVKERIIGAVTIMNDEDATKVWELIQGTFILSNAERIAHDAGEIAAIESCHANDSEYQGSVSQDELLKELGL